MSEQKLLPQYGEQTALERRLAARILKLNPGMGEKSLEIANALCDSGITAAAASTLLQAVYSPTDELGRGQGTRMRWFVEAIRRRYDYKIDKIRNDPKAFKTFIAEMEEVVEMRDTLKGEDVSVSFEAAFLLWELGLDADSILGIVQSECDGLNTPSIVAKHIVQAAQAVKSGFFMELETAIQAMRHGYEYEKPNERPDSR